MSAYHTVEVKYSEEHMDCLVAALEEQYGKGNIEVHKTPQTLYGYGRDARPQKANVIIRGTAHGDGMKLPGVLVHKNVVGGASNDVGFLFKSDGSCEAIVSEYDRGYTYTQKKQDETAKLYAEKVVEKKAAARGWGVVKEAQADGTVKMTLTRQQKAKWGA